MLPPSQFFGGLSPPGRPLPTPLLSKEMFLSIVEAIVNDCLITLTFAYLCCHLTSNSTGARHIVNVMLLSNYVRNYTKFLQYESIIFSDI